MAPNRWRKKRSEGHRMIVTVVRAAERLHKEADRFFRNYGISVAQFNLLVILAENPAGLPQSEIGTLLVVSRANVSGLVRRVGRLGLCRIESDPLDGRVKKVKATTAGKRLLDRIDAPYFKEINRLTRVLSADRMRRVSDTLECLLDEV